MLTSMAGITATYISPYVGLLNPGSFLHRFLYSLVILTTQGIRSVNRILPELVFLFDDTSSEDMIIDSFSFPTYSSWSSLICLLKSGRLFPPEYPNFIKMKCHCHLEDLTCLRSKTIRKNRSQLAFVKETNVRHWRWWSLMYRSVLWGTSRHLP